MRTTIDLHPDLMRAAKIRAAQRGESLKDLFTRAIAHELRTPGRARRGGRVRFPLVGSADGPKATVTSADIEDIFTAEDIERSGG